MLRAAIVVTAVIGVGVAPAAADDPAAPAAGPDYFHKDGGDAVRVRRAGARTRQEKLLIYGLAGGAALCAVVGAYFHYDSSQVAGDLAADTPQDRRWSDELQDRYDRGQTDGTIAIVGYGLAAGLVAATVIAVIKTDPGSEIVVVPTRRVRPTATPVPGGATVGATWSW